MFGATTLSWNGLFRSEIAQWLAKLLDTPVRTPMTHSLTPKQKQRIQEAERILNETLSAHELMREVVDPDDWRPVGQHPNEQTLAGEIRTLEDDLRKVAIELIDVSAEAVWFLGSVEPFRARLDADSREILEWILTKVNPKDLPVLDKASLETGIHQQISNWIRKAQREFKPSWLGDMKACAARRQLRARPGRSEKSHFNHPCECGVSIEGSYRSSHDTAELEGSSS